MSVQQQSDRTEPDSSERNQTVGDDSGENRTARDSSQQNRTEQSGADQETVLEHTPDHAIPSSWNLDRSNVCATSNKHPLTSGGQSDQSGHELNARTLSIEPLLIDAESLVRFVRYLRSVQHESVKITYKGGIVRFRARSEIDSHEMHVRNLTGAPDENSLYLLEKGSAFAVDFLFKYFKPFKLKDIKGRLVTLRLGSDRPMVLSWEHGHFLLAPRVDVE